MNIAIIGLGLIGGSICKTIKKNTTHTCLGIDTDPATLRAALSDGAIDASITPDDLHRADLSIICLHAKATIDFILDHTADFRPGSIVADVCGVKATVVNTVTDKLAKYGVSFVGTHPMAGREFSGYSYATDTLFDSASLIITPGKDQNAVCAMQKLAQQMRFKKIVLSTPENHDKIIAFTSQLAHVVSNAYVKSPTIQNESGFSAGSFLDLTRVAKLNEAMWSDLFIMNRDALLAEVDTLQTHLSQYREALANGDTDAMRTLLKEGRVIKEDSMKLHSKD